MVFSRKQEGDVPSTQGDAKTVLVVIELRLSWPSVICQRQAYNVLKNPDHKRMYDSGDLIAELVQ